MIDEMFFLGKPRSFKGKFDVYPPKVDDILDNKSFGMYRSLLLVSQEDVEDQIIESPDDYLDPNKKLAFPTPLEYLLSLAYNSPSIHKLALDGFKFFLHQEVSFLFEQKKILIGGLEANIENFTKPENLIYIDGEEEYFEFQNFLRQAVGDDPVNAPPIGEDPRVRRIKAKSRYRERIKAKNNQGFTFGANLVGICCMGLGITPLNIGQLSVAATRILTNSTQKKEKYELDIQSLLAGADPKKVKPVYWLTDLNKD